MVVKKRTRGKAKPKHSVDTNEVFDNMYNGDDVVIAEPDPSTGGDVGGEVSPVLGMSKLHTSNKASTVGFGLGPTSRAEAAKLMEVQGEVASRTPIVDDEIFMDLASGVRKVISGNENPNSTPTDVVTHIHRKEELAQLELQTKGRKINNVDNVKLGVPFSTAEFSKGSKVYAPNTYLPNIDKGIDPDDVRDVSQPSIRSPGVTFDGVAPFDPGEGAQKREPVMELTVSDDPRSDNFVACLNVKCLYREGCMRYRMKSQRPHYATLFFPDTCRVEGVYIAVADSDYEDIVPFTDLESTSIPSL